MCNVADWSFRVEDKDSLNLNKEVSEVLNGLVEKVRYDIAYYVIDVVGLEDGEPMGFTYII